MLLNVTNYQGLGTNRNTTKRERMDKAERGEKRRGKGGPACGARSSYRLEVRGFNFPAQRCTIPITGCTCTPLVDVAMNSSGRRTQSKLSMYTFT